MSNKNIKKSAVLGALMALSITGSAHAAAYLDFKDDGTISFGDQLGTEAVKLALLATQRDYNGDGVPGNDLDFEYVMSKADTNGTGTVSPDEMWAAAERIWQEIQDRIDLENAQKEAEKLINQAIATGREYIGSKAQDMSEAEARAYLEGLLVLDDPQIDAILAEFKDDFEIYDAKQAIKGQDYKTAKDILDNLNTLEDSERNALLLASHHDEHTVATTVGTDNGYANAKAYVKGTELSSTDQAKLIAKYYADDVVAEYLNAKDKRHDKLGDAITYLNGLGIDVDDFATQIDNAYPYQAAERDIPKTGYDAARTYLEKTTLDLDAIDKGKLLVGAGYAENVVAAYFSEENANIAADAEAAREVLADLGVDVDDFADVINGYYAPVEEEDKEDPKPPVVDPEDKEEEDKEDPKPPVVDPEDKEEEDKEDPKPPVVDPEDKEEEDKPEVTPTPDKTDADRLAAIKRGLKEVLAQVKDGDIKAALTTFMEKLEKSEIEDVKVAANAILDKVPEEQKEAVKDILQKLNNTDPEAIKEALVELKDKVNEIVDAAKENEKLQAIKDGLKEVLGAVKDGELKEAVDNLVAKLENADIEDVKAAAKALLEKVPESHKQAVKDILAKLDNAADPEAIKGALAELKDKMNQIAADAKDKVEDAAGEVKDYIDQEHKDVVEDAVEQAKELDKQLEEKYAAEFNRLDNRLDKVEDRVEEVGAMAAAMASLQSMGYDPEAPSEFAIGVGQYRSTTGVAIGAFHYPNRDFMLNLSVSTAGDEFMGNVGATWKFGAKKIEGENFEEKVAKAEAMKEAAKAAKAK